MARPAGYSISSNDWPARYLAPNLTVPQIYSMLDKFDNCHDNYGDSTGNQPPPRIHGRRPSNQGRSA